MRCLAGLFALVLGSCAYTAIAPVTDANGTPAVIRIPGVKGDSEPKGSQILQIQEYLSEPYTSEVFIWKYFPELEGQGPMPELAINGLIGSGAEKKDGTKIAIVIPLVAVRANAEPARVEEVAAKIAADCYRRANRKYEVLSIKDLKDKAP